MRKTLLLAITLFLGLGTAADITGKWVAQVQNRNGGTSAMTFDLKYDGTNLPGTVTGGGGGGGRGRKGGGGGAATAAAVQISDTKFDGTTVSFSVKRDVNGQTMVTTYTGTMNGDDLKLKETRQGRNGEQTTDIAAKRSSS
jgi:hypothetical protein